MQGDVNHQAFTLSGFHSFGHLQKCNEFLEVLGWLSGFSWGLFNRVKGRVVHAGNVSFTVDARGRTFVR